VVRPVNIIRVIICIDPYGDKQSQTFNLVGGLMMEPAVGMPVILFGIVSGVRKSGWTRSIS
jgi:hypothetical protein